MEKQEFLPLVAAHLIAALRVATPLVGEADAEDAVQEAIIRAWQAWPTLHDPRAVRAWFLRITLNVCHNWRKGRFGTRQRLTTSVDAHPGLLAPAELEPGELPHVMRMDLYQAVEQLDEHLRQVITFRYFIGLDASEIGAILGIPPVTVRARLRRALHVLRAHLDDIQRSVENGANHV